MKETSTVDDDIDFRFKSESCEGKTMDKEWEEKLLSSCSTLLDGLQFDCTYKVEVHSQRERDQVSLFFPFMV